MGASVSVGKYLPTYVNGLITNSKATFSNLASYAYLPNGSHITQD